MMGSADLRSMWRCGDEAGDVSERGGSRSTWQHCARLGSMSGLDWVTAALRCTNAMTIRRFRVPNEAVVWLVLGMALIRKRSNEDVVKRLGLVLPDVATCPSPCGGRVVSATVPSCVRRCCCGASCRTE